MIASEDLREEQEVVLQQQKQDNGFAKPRFLSKKEREELKKNQEEEEQKQKELKDKEVQQVRKDYQQFNYREWKRKAEREEQRRQQPPKPRSRSRSKEKDGKDKEQSRYITSNTRATVPLKLEGEDKELMSIKLAYLGLNREKKKILKPSEKFKNIFNFEWDSTEDTSVDYNPLYANRLEPNLLFGRGMRAGFDVTEQRKNAIQYDKLIQNDQMEQEKGNDSKNEIKAEDDERRRRDIFDISEADHWSSKRLEEMSQRDWRIFREDMDIIIKGGRVPNPIREWSEASLNPVIIEAIQRLHYKKPTPIQMQTIPIGLERKDLIGIAPTGSGKSAAFLIPLISYLLTLQPQDEIMCKDGPYALILSPTRELAIQIDEEFQRLAIGTHLRSFVVVGGRREEEQAFHLKKGIEIIIGTPGRIKDSLMKKFMVLDQCSWVVLDEADKMIDMGFEGDVNIILDSITTLMKSNEESRAEMEERLSRQGQQQFRVTHLFSATMPPTVEKLAKKYLRCFCFISIGEPGGGKKDIEQRVELISEANKKNRLLSILNQAQPPIIVFANQKKSVELLAKILEKHGKNAVIYHGGKTQQQREQAVEGFKNRQYDILVATDLAGRGLHVEGVQMVINFDAPKNISDFIHRTGRTGRAGKKGIAVTFLTASDEDLFYDLKDFLLKNNQAVPPELEQHPATRVKPGSIPDNLPRRKQIIFAN